MAVTTADYKTQLADAVKLMRRYRHQPDCRCCGFRDISGEAFCTVQEAQWSRAVNRLLTAVTHG